jgi:hypothetical protein
VGGECAGDQVDQAGFADAGCASLPMKSTLRGHNSIQPG